MLDFLSIYKIYKKVVQFIIGPIFVVEDCELFYWVQISKIWCTFCPSLDASLLKATSLKWWLVESKVHIIWQLSQSWWVLSNAHWSDCLIEFGRSSQPISSFCNHQQFWQIFPKFGKINLRQAGFSNVCLWPIFFWLCPSRILAVQAEWVIRRITHATVIGLCVSL